MSEPRLLDVQCLNGRGLHRMAYWEWGDPANDTRAGVRARPVAPGARLRHPGAHLVDHYRVVCPDVVGPRPVRLAPRSHGLRPAAVRGRHGDLAGAPERTHAALGRHVDGRAHRPGPRRAGPARRCASWCSTTSDRARSGRPRAHRRLSRPAGAGTTLEEAADAIWTISHGFGPHTREQWLALTEPQLKRDGDALVPHYDPDIAVPFAPSRRRWPRLARPRCGRPTTPCVARRCCCAAPTPTCCRRDTARAMSSAGRAHAWWSSPASAMRRCWCSPSRSNVVREFLLSP